MPVYVDAIFYARRFGYGRGDGNQALAAATGAKNNHRWCHMWADTPEELHALAARIGLRRSWFQEHSRLPHYDLTPGRRRAALAAGAIEMSVVEWRKRVQHPGP